MGGEHNGAIIRKFAEAGSSPHGRGTYHGQHQRAYRLRFIPAWAGNINPLRRGGKSAAVHPRMGGEHSSFRSWMKYDFGSSPHGRGTSDSAAYPAYPVRFIPAWAGNIYSNVCVCEQMAVHPRMGGEHNSNSRLRALRVGSSPHGRGTCAVSTAAPVGHRFIPAWAGNIIVPENSAWTRPVHPRMGGEHPETRMTTWRRSGSSPHGRGTYI